MDVEYRKQWDSYVKELYARDADGRNVIYWHVNFPFPMSNRDYVYARERKGFEINGTKVYTVLAKSVECASIPE